jgi:hypothetical protein
VQRLAGRAFLVGESIKRTDDDPHPEETMWFPVDKITLFRVFKNIEDARKAFDEADPLGRQRLSEKSCPATANQHGPQRQRFPVRR